VDCFAVDPRPLFDVLAERPLVMHNGAFDLAMLGAMGFVPGRVRDTMLMSLLVDGARKPKGFHGLEECVRRELGLTLDKTLQKSDWSGPLSAEQLSYAAHDPVVTLRLYDAFERKVRDAGLERVADIEFRCLPALVWLATSGAPFDSAAWQVLAGEAAAERRRLAEELDAAAPANGMFAGWKWDSNEEVKKAFATAGVTLADTEDETLAALDLPLAKLLRKYRKVKKLVETYGPEWTQYVTPTGRIHAGWRQIGAESGRMSCSAPPLQTLPRDRRYRRCFAAPPGRLLIKCDYSQIELRIAAKIAGEDRMLDAYRRGQDLHVLTAQRVLGVADVTKEQRQLAKAINFGLLYGMGIGGFRSYAETKYGVRLGEGEAKTYRRGFFNAYPGLSRWHEAVRRKHAAETRTLTGRRRLYTDKMPDTERLNTPVQGTGADGLKTALALLWERRDVCPGAFPVLVVYDELVVEADEAQAEQATAWLRQAMLDGMAPLIAPVPVEVEVKVARTWAGD
jgi:DNA polymerase I